MRSWRTAALVGVLALACGSGVAAQTVKVPRPQTAAPAAPDPIPVLESIADLLLSCEAATERLKLECYQTALDLARPFATIANLPALPDAPPASLDLVGGWNISSIDETHTALMFSEGALADSDRRASLGLRCIDERTSIVMLLGRADAFPPRASTVALGIGDAAPATSLWTMNSDNERLLFGPSGNDAIRDIQRMSRVDFVTLTVTRPDGTRSDYRFPMEGIEEVVDRFATPCHWSRVLGPGFGDELDPLEGYAAFRDWFYYRETAGIYTCIVGTATETAPEAWTVPTYLMFGADPDTPDGRLDIRLLVPNPFDQDRPAEAVVDGRRFALSFAADGDLTAEAADGGTAVNGDVVEAIRRGQVVEIRGTDELSGEPLSFVFSASGFTQAFNHMMSECDRSDLAVWLN
jgi:hypothetical protein